MELLNPFVLCIAAMAAAVPTGAQNYPVKTVRIITQ
jgi:hypothetical protein